MANGLLANAQESHTDLLWAGSGGFDTVHHDDTLTGMGTELYPLGVNSAILNDAPWLSAAKEIAPTQTLQPGQYIQALSSLTVSGYKNHCVAVKGGVYRFPNKWEIASGIAETNYFMPQSSMSGYLPTSSFTSYTASIANNLENNWNYTNSAYSLSINNFYNKLDASAFSAYTADAGETYTLVGGDNISISSDDEEKTTTISVTGEVGDTTPWISGAKILAETKYMEPGEYIQALSSFTLSGNKNHCIAVKGGGYLFPTNPMLASGISSYLTGEFVPSSTFSSFVSSWSDHLSTLYSNDSYLSSCVSNISANKLDASSYHELTAGTNIDIQNYVISSKDWTNEIREASANAFNEATASNPTSSTQWNSCYETVNTNSGEWQKVSGKLDTTAFESYTANDETYLLKGGYNIGVSSDDVNKETTIYYTGTNGDEEVNQVVRQYSAAGTWLTSHQDISNLMPKSESAKFYPMTGNPSGFLTAHQSLTNYYTKTDTSSKQEISAALQYISSNAGKTYTGVDPIQVNNSTNEISITGETLSAGPGIALFESGGCVVISAGNDDYNFFPMTGTNGTTGFTANMDCSSMMLTTGASPAGGYVKQTTRGVQYEAYPATDVSASWYNIITATNNRSNCYCIRFTNDMTAASLEDYSAYDKVTVVHSNEYTPDCMLYWDGNTKVFPSGLYCELVKGTNDQNQTDWFFTTSGWINNLEWDWD